MTKINDNRTSDGNEEWISSLKSNELKTKLELLMRNGADIKKPIAHGLYSIIDRKAKMRDAFLQRALEKHKGSSRKPQRNKDNLI